MTKLMVMMSDPDPTRMKSSFLMRMRMSFPDAARIAKGVPFQTHFGVCFRKAAEVADVVERRGFKFSPSE